MPQSSPLERCRPVEDPGLCHGEVTSHWLPQSSLRTNQRQQLKPAVWTAQGHIHSKLPGRRPLTPRPQLHLISLFSSQRKGPWGRCVVTFSLDALSPEKVKKEGGFLPWSVGRAVCQSSWGLRREPFFPRKRKKLSHLPLQNTIQTRKLSGDLVLGGEGARQSAISP